MQSYVIILHSFPLPIVHPFAPSLCCIDQVDSKVSICVQIHTVSMKLAFSWSMNRRNILHILNFHLQALLLIIAQAQMESFNIAESHMESFNIAESQKQACLCHPILP